MNKFTVFETIAENGAPLFYAVKGDTVLVSGNGCQSFKPSQVSPYYVRSNMAYSHMQKITQ